MDGVILTSILLFWLFLVLSFVNFYSYSKNKETLKVHINEVAMTQQLMKVKKKSTLDRFIIFLSRYADDFSALGERINFYSESPDVEVLLIKAGNPYGLSVARFQGFKIVCVILGFIIGTFLFFLGFPFANVFFVTLPFIGFFIPIFLVRGKAKKRQELLRRDLPDFLDTVSISLQAGSGLDGAIKEVISYYIGPIQEEFSRFIQEIELGVPREKAYTEMLNRNDNVDFQNVIKSLIQGSRLGVPVATTFRNQANEMRRISLEQVKEKAAKASPKVTLITSFIIAPLIMLMILGLIILNMIYGEDSIFKLFSN
ncbi:type II secretion system F family protein [Cytobacillus dafuensis]|uniref:Type II secretion system F family protein n=1 Tax=Cytobacillus dafuensis TaxID=1742359 RepID=A0A5B8Z0H6_CYTDA|nr:type II secretion system F family protein [Cytobacillus dafuensis]QED46415.1 type II secretion system F family protein [Cytobacillus dafuensis]